MNELVRAWLDRDLEVQHLSAPPDDDTAREWEGTALCGRSGTLRWVHGEQVDGPSTCAECAALAGPAPPLEGDWPGPV